MVICFPSLPTGSSFSEENSIGRVLGVTSHSSSLGRPSMVSSSYFTSGSSSHSSTVGQGSSVLAAVTQVTSRSWNIPITHLAAMQYRMEAPGFSSAVTR